MSFMRYHKALTTSTYYGGNVHFKISLELQNNRNDKNNNKNININNNNSNYHFDDSIDDKIVIDYYFVFVHRRTKEFIMRKSVP